MNKKQCITCCSTSLWYRVKLKVNGYFSPNNNSIWKSCVSIRSFFFKFFISGKGKKPKLFLKLVLARNEAGANPFVEKPECGCPLVRMLLVGLYDMAGKNVLDALNNAHVPLLIGVLCPDLSWCQEKRLTSSMVTPRRGTATPTSQLKSKFNPDPEGFSVCCLLTQPADFPQHVTT